MKKKKKLPKLLKKELRLLLQQFPPAEICKRINGIIKIYTGMKSHMHPKVVTTGLQTLQALLSVFSLARKEAKGIRVKDLRLKKKYKKK